MFAEQAELAEVIALVLSHEGHRAEYGWGRHREVVELRVQRGRAHARQLSFDQFAHRGPRGLDLGERRIAGDLADVVESPLAALERAWHFLAEEVEQVVARVDQVGGDEGGGVGLAPAGGALLGLVIGEAGEAVAIEPGVEPEDVEGADQSGVHGRLRVWVFEL